MNQNELIPVTSSIITEFQVSIQLRTHNILLPSFKTHRTRTKTHMGLHSALSGRLVKDDSQGTLGVRRQRDRQVFTSRKLICQSQRKSNYFDTPLGITTDTLSSTTNMSATFCPCHGNISMGMWSKANSAY